MYDKQIPPLIKDILDRYAAGEGGALTGGTRPIVENDFVGVLYRAGSLDLAELRAVAEYLQNELPEACWGTPEKMRAWVWRQELAAHPNAERVIRVERDLYDRLGPDTHTVNRYAVRWDIGDGGREEVLMFVECLGIFPSDRAAALYVDALRAEVR